MNRRNIIIIKLYKYKNTWRYRYKNKKLIYLNKKIIFTWEKVLNIL